MRILAYSACSILALAGSAAAAGKKPAAPVEEPRPPAEEPRQPAEAAGKETAAGTVDAWVDQLVRPRGADEKERAFVSRQAAAARLLGESHDSTVLPFLVKALESPYAAVRGPAAAALGNLDEPGAAPALLRALKERKPETTEVEFQYKGVQDGKELAELTGKESLASDAFTGPRMQIVRALIRLRSASAVPALIAALPDEPRPLQQEIALGLSVLANASFLPAEAAAPFDPVLLQSRWQNWWKENQGKKREEWVLDGFNRYGREHGWSALGNLSDPASLGAIGQGLLAAEPWIRENALDALARRTPADGKDAEALIGMLDGLAADPKVRENPRAAYILESVFLEWAAAGVADRPEKAEELKRLRLSRSPFTALHRPRLAAWLAWWKKTPARETAPETPEKKEGASE